MLRKFSLLLSVLLFASSFAFTQSSGNQSADAKDKDDDAIFHGPSINDVNAIGHRNVGCDRGFANWYSLNSHPYSQEW